MDLGSAFIPPCSESIRENCYKRVVLSMLTRGTFKSNKISFFLHKEAFRTFTGSIATGFIITNILFSEPALATDAVATYKCLLGGCSGELAKCIGNPSCAANIACLETCSNRSDEGECEVRCGDLFQNKVIDEFSSCAISKAKCIPQRPNDGQFPEPPACALVSKFRTTDFTGKWYITSGLNPSFDTYNCQIQKFLGDPHKLTAELSWRVNTPDGGFITRNAIQNFVQDSKLPGLLHNHGNKFLNYQDDWYILSSRIKNQPDDYVFVYYVGSNDAWNGYGGAVVYTRSSILSDNIIPQLKQAAAKVGLDFDKFTKTDNSCVAQPTILAKIKNTVLGVGSLFN